MAVRSQDLCSASWSSQPADSAMLSSSRGSRRLCCCLHLFVHPTSHETEFHLYCSTSNLESFNSKPPQSLVPFKHNCKWLESPRVQALKFCPTQRQACSILDRCQLKAYLQSGPLQCSLEYRWCNAFFIQRA